MNQLKTGAVLNYISIALNMVVGLLYTPYMLRMLGQSEYGLYSLAASIIAYLTVLDLGFGNAIVRYTAKFRTEGKKREQEEMFGMFFVLYIGIGLLAVACGTLLAGNVESIFLSQMNEEEVDKMRIMLWLMTFNLAFTFPMSIWGAIMTAYERFVFQRIISILRSIFNPIVMIFLLVIGYKAIALVVVTTAFNVFTLLINYWYCRHRLYIHMRFSRFRWKFLKEVGIYSFWIFLNAIMDRIYWSTGQFVLGIYRGSVAIAVYAVAVQLQQMYMMFSTAISSLFLPKVTAMVTKGDNAKELSDLFIRTGRIQYIVLAYVLSAFIVFGRPFIRLWAGAGYEDAYIIALLFFIPLLVPLMQNIGIIILQARNQMKFRSILYVIISICCFILSFPLAKIYGGIGCAVATAIALIAGQIIGMNIYYHRKQGIDIIRFWCEIGRMSIIPILLTVISLIIINNMNVDLSTLSHFLFLAMLYSIIYILLFYRFSMNHEEKKLFVSPIKQLIKQKKYLYDSNNR